MMPHACAKAECSQRGEMLNISIKGQPLELKDWPLTLRILDGDVPPGFTRYGKAEFRAPGTSTDFKVVFAAVAITTGWTNDHLGATAS